MADEIKEKAESGLETESPELNMEQVVTPKSTSYDLGGSDKTITDPAYKQQLDILNFDIQNRPQSQPFNYGNENVIVGQSPIGLAYVSPRQIEMQSADFYNQLEHQEDIKKLKALSLKEKQAHDAKLMAEYAHVSNLRYNDLIINKQMAEIHNTLEDYTKRYGSAAEGRYHMQIDGIVEKQSQFWRNFSAEFQQADMKAQEIVRTYNKDKVDSPYSEKEYKAAKEYEDAIEQEKVNPQNIGVYYKALKNVSRATSIGKEVKTLDFMLYGGNEHKRDNTTGIYMPEHSSPDKDGFVVKKEKYTLPYEAFRKKVISLYPQYREENEHNNEVLHDLYERQKSKAVKGELVQQEKSNQFNFGGYGLVQAPIVKLSPDANDDSEKVVSEISEKDGEETFKRTNYTYFGKKYPVSQIMPENRIASLPKDLTPQDENAFRIKDKINETGLVFDRKKESVFPTAIVTYKDGSSYPISKEQLERIKNNPKIMEDVTISSGIGAQYKVAYKDEKGKTQYATFNGIVTPQEQNNDVIQLRGTANELKVVQFYKQLNNPVQELGTLLNQQQTKSDISKSKTQPSQKQNDKKQSFSPALQKSVEALYHKFPNKEAEIDEKIKLSKDANHTDKEIIEYLNYNFK